MVTEPAGSTPHRALATPAPGGLTTPEAFGVLFDELAQDIFGFCLRRCGDRDRAEDLLSVVFLEAWRCREMAVAVDGSLRPWLFGIAANVVHAEARARHRHRRALDRYHRANPEVVQADHADAVVEQVTRPALQRELKVAIASLPPRERAIADLCLVEQIPVSVAAAALDIPLGTAKSRLNRARQRLRRLLRSSEVLGRQDVGDHVPDAHADRVPSGRRS